MGEREREREGERGEREESRDVQRQSETLQELKSCAVVTLPWHSVTWDRLSPPAYQIGTVGIVGVRDRTLI